MGLIKIIPKRQWRWQKYVTDNLRKYNIIVGSRQLGKTTLFAECVKSVAYADNIKNPWINICSDTKLRLKLLYGGRFYDMFSCHPDYHWPEGTTTQIRVRRPQGDHFHLNIFGATHQPRAPEGTTSHFNLVDEAGYVSKRYIKETLMPTADHTGGINIITGTVDPGDFMSLAMEAEYKMKQKDSPWFYFYFNLESDYAKECRTEKQIAEIKDRYNMSDPEERVQFLKMYMCDWFAGLSGTPFASSYYQAENSGRIGEFPYDPNFKVGTTWDNGLGYKAVWYWQIVHHTPRFIGFHIWKDESLRKACRDIKEWYREHDAEQYIHIFPHTMRVREESDGVGLWEKCMDYLGWKGDYIKNRKVGNVENKIDISCNVMSSCLFNRATCGQGLLSLLKYSRTENKKTKARSQSFVKDSYSHGAEAFTEFCMAWENEELFYADDTRKGGDDNREGYNLHREVRSPIYPY